MNSPSPYLPNRPPSLEMMLSTIQKNSPEFYDDDLPILFCGSSAPSAFLDPEDDTLVGLYGLLSACGTPSGDHDGTLKRSARPAMNLVKSLLLDYKEPGQKKTDLNPFAKAFLSLPPTYYHAMNLDLHCSGDERGGAKEDACNVIALILVQHLSPDGEELRPVVLEELMSGKGQQEFELWSAKNVPASVQETIKQNAAARQTELQTQQRQETRAMKQAGLRDEDIYDEDEDQSDADKSDRDDQDDPASTFRKKKRDPKKETRTDVAIASGGVATRWEDSQLAREQAARAASSARAASHGTVRDSLDAAQEAAEREEGKEKAFSKDPLEIRTEENFNLRNVEKGQAEQMEQALHDLQEELQKAEATGRDDLIKKIMLQKDSLEALVERLGGIDAMEDASNLKQSVLPTSPKFDPILFLTLVHRKTSHAQLVESLDRLSSKSQSQMEQLQDLVRDNFPLFVRCAEGFEEFRQKSESEMGLGLHERIDKLEAIAESCAFQAKKSFKPLLDNTSEVRKVQSSMSVLQRVAPILQVPANMRQHLENRRYSQALKTYRRVLVIDEETCRIQLLMHVKSQAELCLHDARRDLERRLAQANVSIDELLEGIRDLNELIELDVPTVQKFDDSGVNIDHGVYEIDGNIINVRKHSPALACLLLQAAHFSARVNHLINDIERNVLEIFTGDKQGTSDDYNSPKGPSGASNQWKYDVLDARVLSTSKSVALAKIWIPRLVSVARAAKEDEKRKAARIGNSRKKEAANESRLSAFEVFISNVTPTFVRLIEHATFCSIGSNNRAGGLTIVETFGEESDEKLRQLLKSPLPPSQSAKVGTELAELVETISDNSVNANELRPDANSSTYSLEPLGECKKMGDSAVVTIEKRRSIYAFDVCARSCSNRATGSGKFEAETLVNTLQTLSDQLTRPDECSNEVEKGCELVVRRCCEGLASYVRDRGDAARLNAVSECADAIADGVDDIVREASYLTKNSDTVREVILEDIVGLESAMFEEYLENIRKEVADSVQLDWLDSNNNGMDNVDELSVQPSFPPYLSASLLAIVRCRAQVEQSLGDKIRQSDNTQYQHLAMVTVADGVIEGLSTEIEKRKLRLKVRQADRLANELEFLRNTLSKFLSNDMMTKLNATLHMVGSKAGRGPEHQRDGPEGLAALEELERLGRVYVVCLGD